MPDAPKRPRWRRYAIVGTAIVVAWAAAGVALALVGTGGRGAGLAVAASARHSGRASGASPSGDPAPQRSGAPPAEATGTTGPPLSAPALPPAADPNSPARIMLQGQYAPSPFVMVRKGVYYLYSSSWGASPNLPLRTSTDLVNWSAPTEAMPRLPSWAVLGLTWDPAVYKIGRRYVNYFSDGLTNYQPDTKCIGVAWASNPRGPFQASDKPFICQLDHHGDIDPRAFRAPDGTRWLIWKSDDNADVPGTEHTTIFSQQLSRDGLHLVGGLHEILHADQPWEGRIVESPQMVMKNGHYWLFFSANWFNQADYAIGVAECQGPAGPCDNPSQPWLVSNAQGQGPGEESLFADGPTTWMVYTPFFSALDRTDPVALVRVVFGPGGPYLAQP